MRVFDGQEGCSREYFESQWGSEQWAESTLRHHRPWTNSCGRSQAENSAFMQRGSIIELPLGQDWSSDYDENHLSPHSPAFCLVPYLPEPPVREIEVTLLTAAHNNHTKLLPSQNCKAMARRDYYHLIAALGLWKNDLVVTVNE